MYDIYIHLYQFYLKYLKCVVTSVDVTFSYIRNYLNCFGTVFDN